MSPLQAAAVEKRLGAVRNLVVRKLSDTARPTQRRRNLVSEARRSAKERTLKAVLAIIDRELQSVKGA